MKETFTEDFIQLYFKMHVKGGINREWIDLKEERKIFPALLEWFAPTWCSRRFPQNDDDLPKGVTPGHHFFTFDKKEGLLLCVGYYFDENIVEDTRDFKEALNKILDNISGQFSDGWGEGLEQIDFKIGRKTYAIDPSGKLVRILAPVACNNCMVVRWNSVEEIEHVEWMLAYNNDINNILWHPKKHEEKKSRATSWDDTKQMYEYVEKHKDMFFCSR